MLRDTDSAERRIEKLERINAALMQRLAVLEEQVQALSARVQTLEAARMPSDGSTG